MGITSAQYGSLLIPIIMTKLTPELRLHIARESRNDVWEIRELLTLIKQEVEAREATEMVKVPAMGPTGGSHMRVSIVSHLRIFEGASKFQHLPVRYKWRKKLHLVVVFTQLNVFIVYMVTIGA